MFSDSIGTPTTLGDAPAIRVVPGERGHAVYGPYAHVRPGVFRADFALRLDRPDLFLGVFRF